MKRRWQSHGKWRLVIIGVLLLLAIGIVPPQHAQAQSQNKVLRFLEEQESTLVNYYDGDYPAWYIVSSYGDYYQVDPFLLLALMEAATGVVTDPEPSEEALRQPFGAVGPRGFTRQVQWAIRELMLGRGTYTEPPTLRFSDGKQVTLDLRQSDLWLSIRRFTAQDRTYDEWYALDERMRTLYPIYRQEQPVVADDSSYAFFQPPTISRATYRAILREWNSPAYPEAEAMYDVLVDAGIDPAIDLHGAAPLSLQCVSELHRQRAGVGDTDSRLCSRRNDHAASCVAGLCSGI
jgi:hypothetical protein